jgi:hypothetical protein
MNVNTDNSSGKNVKALRLSVSWLQQNIVRSLGFLHKEVRSAAVKVRFVEPGGWGGKGIMRKKIGLWDGGWKLGWAQRVEGRAGGKWDSV